MVFIKQKGKHKMDMVLVSNRYLEIFVIINYMLRLSCFSKTWGMV